MRRRKTGIEQKLQTRDENAASYVLYPLGRINRFPQFVPRLYAMHTGNPFRKAPQIGKRD